MRFHIKTLRTVHRARFQLTAHLRQRLVDQGSLVTSTRVHRLIDGVAHVRPQQTCLIHRGHHWKISNLGHGWFETMIDRDADPLVDRGLVHRLLGLRGWLNEGADLAARPGVHDIAVEYGEAQVRDRDMIKRGLYPPKIVDYISLLGVNEQRQPMSEQEQQQLREMGRALKYETTHVLTVTAKAAGPDQSEHKGRGTNLNWGLPVVDQVAHLDIISTHLDPELRASLDNSLRMVRAKARPPVSDLKLSHLQARFNKRKQA